MKVAGLFAGIGGFELGLASAGHETALLVEIDEAANRVLDARFPGIARATDVRALARLPSGTGMIAAGFPCQDLSQAGQTRGIRGSRSGLVEEVFRLARQSRIPWIVLENVPFMLQLDRGAAIRYIADELEAMGYAWAYRKIDTRAFGLPQRRERIFLIASLAVDPARILFAEQCEPGLSTRHEGSACGFYWTEGTRGLGWAVDAIPTLKGGSAIGIPSPPAIWMPDGRICTPDIRDAERLQGFPAGWTEPAEQVARPGYRWKLAGNAVSVPVAAWIGAVLNRPQGELPPVQGRLASEGSWPAAAFGARGERFAVECSTWPRAERQTPLEEFLRYPTKPLSTRAAKGFRSRLEASSLRYPSEFGRALEAATAPPGSSELPS